MKKFLVILAGLLLSVNGAFATRYVTQTYPARNYAYNPSVYNNGTYNNNYNGNYNSTYNNSNYNNSNYHNVNSNKLSQVEKSVYGRTYEGQSYENRLNRLEKSLFNRTYSNLPYDERINNLVVNYNNNYNNNSAPVNNKKWGGLLNTIGTMFVGSPTGLSPQVNPYWNDNFYAPNGRQTDYYGNNGWYHNNNQIGSGTGIHIID